MGNSLVKQAIVKNMTVQSKMELWIYLMWDILVYPITYKNWKIVEFDMKENEGLSFIIYHCLRL